MTDSLFLEYVGNNPRMRILQYFIEGRDFDYTLTDLLNAKVSWETLNEIVPKLAKLGIVIKTRKIGRATLYKINETNIVSKQFIKLYDSLIIEKLSEMEENCAEQTIENPVRHRSFAWSSPLLWLDRSTMVGMSGGTQNGKKTLEKKKRIC